MSEAGVKLGYNTTQRIVRVDFDIEDCLNSPNASESLLNRAKSKLELEITQGNIDFYILFPDKISLLWAAILQRFKGRPNKKQFSIIIGQGARLISRIVTLPSPDDKFSCILNYDAPSIEINNWRPDWVVLNVLKQLEGHGVTGRCNETQIVGSFFRASAGEVIQNLSIGFAPINEEGNLQYKLIANKKRREISLAIFDHKVFSDREQLNQILVTAADGVSKMNERMGLNFTFLKNELALSIKSAMSGAEAMGVGMPLLFLIAYCPIIAPPKSKKSEAANAIEIIHQELPNPSPKPKNKPIAPLESYPGIGILQTEDSPDKMESFISSFDTIVYADSAFPANADWLNKELKRLGISESNEKLKGSILAALSQKKDINGLMVAQGTKPKSPSKPFLFKSYLEKKKTGENLDLRESQASKVVKPGDLVCEVRYKEKGFKGKDIYGEAIQPEDGEAMVIDMGSGIELREAGKYYATIEGMPLFEDKKVSISEIYIHKGNINLKSGNIYFNGNAKIEGNIESGSTVVVRGDLEITGSIEAAFVRSGGDIKVGGGVTTTEKGRLQARGNLTAEYIGNSVIATGGDIEVKKSIINSSIITGGSINININDGVLAGGQISCRGDIHTGRLGFPKGARTVLMVGLDWRAELKLRIRKARLLRVKNKNEEDRKNLRELIRKKDNQLTAKHREMINDLQSALQRQREIMDKISALIVQAEGLMNWDKEVQIFVHETCSSNIEVYMNASKIPVNSEVAGVLISLKKTKDGFVKPIPAKEAG